MSKYILFKTRVNLYKIDICNFDYNIAMNYLRWYFGMETETVDSFDEKFFEKTIYEFLYPSLFYKSSNISGTKIYFKDIDYNLIGIFDTKHLEKCFKYWENFEDYGSFNKQWEDLQNNYKKYLDEVIIKDIIE